MWMCSRSIFFSSMMVLDSACSILPPGLDILSGPKACYLGQTHLSRKDNAMSDPLVSVPPTHHQALRLSSGPDCLLPPLPRHPLLHASPHRPQPANAALPLSANPPLPSPLQASPAPPPTKFAATSCAQLPPRSNHPAESTRLLRQRPRRTGPTA